MHEREPPHTDEQRFWQTEQTIGQVFVDGASAELCLRSRSVQEPYHPSRRREIVPISASGSRTYTLSQAVVRTPVGSPEEPGRQHRNQPAPERPRRLEELRVGDLQSFCYAADQLLVIWDGLLLPDHRSVDPASDPLLALLWRGAEACLLGRFGGVERIVTPSWEPVYETAAYRAFLERLGYRRISALAFAKRIAAGPDGLTGQHEPMTATHDDVNIDQERR